MVCEILPLHAPKDIAAVHEFYQAAPDYWEMADRRAPDHAKAAAFFTDAPPHCGPEGAFHAGFFLEGRLSGLGMLHRGFPQPDDYYLGLMMLGPWARGQGYGRRFLEYFIDYTRKAGGTAIYLAVLDENPRGRAFWMREGFEPTGICRHDAETGHRLERFQRLL